MNTTQERSSNQKIKIGLAATSLLVIGRARNSQPFRNYNSGSDSSARRLSRQASGSKDNSGLAVE